MAEYDFVVRNGTVATAADTMRADIGIADGRIVAIGDNLDAGWDEIDASGRLVLPGGVDSHCHLEQIAASGARSADDFLTGSAAAAAGGTTTIIPFASQLRGQSMREVVADYHARAEARAGIDYAFHMIVSDPTPATLGELPELIRAGHGSLKIFMCYEHRRFSDRLILEVLALARRERAITLVHAENHDCCAFASDLLIRAGKSAPRFHWQGRPVVAEQEATHRILALAELAGAPVAVAHVTSAEALAEIVAARRRGQTVLAETCPHYLMLTREAFEGPPAEVALRLCSPPLREDEDRQVLWRAVAGGDLDMVNSDHAPTDGAYVEGTPFTALSNGLPGLETRLPILFSEGVGKGRMSLNRFVALSATNAARIFGLYPQKGTIAVGADADLALWDPERKVTIAGARLHHAVDHTPFEGLEVTGWPVLTLSRGEVVARDGEPLVTAGRGRFLEQGPSIAYGGPAA